VLPQQPDSKQVTSTPSRTHTTTQYTCTADCLAREHFSLRRNRLLDWPSVFIAAASALEILFSCWNKQQQSVLVYLMEKAMNGDCNICKGIREGCSGVQDIAALRFQPQKWLCVSSALHCKCPCRTASYTQTTKRTIACLLCLEDLWYVFFAIKASCAFLHCSVASSGKIHAGVFWTAPCRADLFCLLQVPC
jgi:hypothetical protein